MISEEYRKQNQLLHKTSCMYGAGGFKNAEEVHQLIKQYQAFDVLDYGCGKASLAEKIGPMVRNYDPAIEAFSSSPSPADLVVCADVMEHVEPEFVESVLGHIKLLTKKAAYFVIACGEAKKTLPDGRNAHICIRPPEWWDETLGRYFVIKTKERMDRDAIRYVVEPC